MGLAFLHHRADMKNQIVAIDLGTRTTTAVLLESRGAGNGFRLLNYLVWESPLDEKTWSRELLAEHFKKILAELGTKTKRVVIVIGRGETFLRHAEFPLGTPSHLRKMIKLNPANFFQENVVNYAFDCYVLPVRQLSQKPRGDQPSLNFNTLVGAAREHMVADVEAAATMAGLTVEEITLSQVSHVNAFLLQPQAARQDGMVLLHIGLKNSIISILHNGELKLSRVVDIGGDKFTSGLAESMNINYSTAEGIKLAIPDKVRDQLHLLVSPLTQEIRASIEFFEHHHNHPVGQLYVSGGSARSPFIVQTLQNELM